MKVRNNMWQTGENRKGVRDSALNRGIRLKGDLAAYELSAKVQELIELAVAVALGGEALITDHVQSARCAGAAPREIVETVRLAELVGDEATAANGTCALKALKQFDSLVYYYQKLAETAIARRQQDIRARLRLYD